MSSEGRHRGREGHGLVLLTLPLRKQAGTAQEPLASLSWPSCVLQLPSIKSGKASGQGAGSIAGPTRVSGSGPSGPFQLYNLSREGTSLSEPQFSHQLNGNDMSSSPGGLLKGVDKDHLKS